MGKRVTIRDTPFLCVFFAMLMAALSAALMYAWRLDVANRESLQRISGRIESIEHTDRPKAGLKIQIYVRDGERLHHLTQDDFSYAIPAIQTLRVGDTIAALVKHDSLGRNLDWVWEINRGDEQVLSYSETFNFLADEAARTRPLAYGAGVLSGLLLIIGVFLRRRFGAWNGADYNP
jgi:hypothetical protein